VQYAGTLTADGTTMGGRTSAGPDQSSFTPSLPPPLRGRGVWWRANRDGGAGRCPAPVGQRDFVLRLVRVGRWPPRRTDRRGSRR
jgi:hypothetical protein